MRFNLFFCFLLETSFFNGEDRWCLEIYLKVQRAEAKIKRTILPDGWVMYAFCFQVNIRKGRLISYLQEVYTENIDVVD